MNNCHTGLAIGFCMTVMSNVRHILVTQHKISITDLRDRYRDGEKETEIEIETDKEDTCVPGLWMRSTSTRRYQDRQQQCFDWTNQAGSGRNRPVVRGGGRDTVQFTPISSVRYGHEREHTNQQHS